MLREGVCQVNTPNAYLLRRVCSAEGHALSAFHYKGHCFEVI